MMGEREHAELIAVLGRIADALEDLVEQGEPFVHDDTHLELENKRLEAKLLATAMPFITQLCPRCGRKFTVGEPHPCSPASDAELAAERPTPDDIRPVRVEPFRTRKCSGCGYNLSGVSGIECPQCGRVELGPTVGPSDLWVCVCGQTNIRNLRADCHVCHRPRPD